MTTPQPDSGAISCVTEIDYPSSDRGPPHHLFLPMSEPEPLPGPQLEPELEAG